MIAALSPAPGDFIIEIGAGHGELTIPLACECERVGCRLVAIEKDEELVSRIIPHESLKRVEIVHGDALELIPQIIRERKLGASGWKLIGNIPYYLSGRLLRMLGESPRKPARAVLALQREVAKRIVASPPGMNLLASTVQVWAKETIIRSLGRGDFSPRPKVDSAIILLETEERLSNEIAYEQYFRAVKRIFAQPRKTLLNNLRGGKGKMGGIKEKLRLVGLSGRERPQDLSVPVLIKLSQIFD